MAVQITPDSSSALLAAREAAKLRASKPADSAAAQTSRLYQQDSVKMTLNPASAQIAAVHGTMTQAQRSMGALNVAGQSLNEVSKQLGLMQGILSTGRTDAQARLALANSLANMDSTMRAAKFDGQNVLDGSPFEMNAGDATLNIKIGGSDLQNLASLLASGGRGISAVALDNVPVAQRSLQQAREIVSAALGEVSTHTNTVSGLLNQADTKLDTVGGALSPENVSEAAANVATSIATAPGLAAQAQATVGATAAQRLLTD